MTINQIRRINRTRSIAYRRAMATLHSSEDISKRITRSIEFYAKPTVTVSDNRSTGKVFNI